jgi:acyl dehydratase
MDRHAMADSNYGARVAHGLLGSSLVIGMLSLSAPQVVGRGVPGAYLYSFDSNYRDGLRFGDTVRVKWQVTKKSADAGYDGYGLVTTAFEVITQDSTAIYDGTIDTLVRTSRSSDAILTLRPSEHWQITPFKSEPDRTWYVEDLPLGHGGETDGRTITETDIVNFSALTGDYDPRYVNVEFASRDIFGSRIAQGLFLFSAVFGLWISDQAARPRQPKTDKPMVAGHLNDRATFVAPVRIGDTIRCRYQTLAARASKTRPGIGLITTGLQAINQHDEVVMDGSTILMGIAKG